MSRRILDSLSRSGARWNRLFNQRDRFFAALLTRQLAHHVDPALPPGRRHRGAGREEAAMLAAVFAEDGELPAGYARAVF
jgi:hypothetical protein